MGEKQIVVGIFLFAFILTMMGQCEMDNRAQQVKVNSVSKRSEWKSNIGMEPVPEGAGAKSREISRIIRESKKDSPEYLLREEFYEGMEEAEMKGMADDPSAKDIYDEFNRDQK